MIFELICPEGKGKFVKTLAEQLTARLTWALKSRNNMVKSYKTQFQTLKLVKMKVKRALYFVKFGCKLSVLIHW